MDVKSVDLHSITKDPGRENYIQIKKLWFETAGVLTRNRAKVTAK